MKRPICIDLYSCGSGSGEGYHRAGYDTLAIDIVAKVLEVNPFPHACMDALEAVVLWLDGQGVTFSDGRTLYLEDIALFHASPPCQGYSIMNNLPWIRKRVYPLEIVACRELLRLTGKPYVIENVAGAASKKNLEKLGLLEHRLRAGYLCGGMFGLPIYRHRYFETNFFWPQPGHPKHVVTRQAESTFAPRPLGVWEQQYETENPGRSAQAARVNTGWRAGHDGQGVKERRRGQTASPPMAGHSPGNAPAALGNGAQKSGVAVGHAAGWRIAAEAMDVGWMRRYETTQAVPPIMTEHIGRWSPPILALAVLA